MIFLQRLQSSTKVLTFFLTLPLIGVLCLEVPLHLHFFFFFNEFNSKSSLIRRDKKCDDPKVCFAPSPSSNHFTILSPPPILHLTHFQLSSNLSIPRHTSLVPQHLFSRKSSNRKQTVTVQVTGIISMLTGFISMPIACKHAGQQKGSREREGGRSCEYECKCNKTLWPGTSVSLDCGQPLCLKALGIAQFIDLLQGTLWPRTNLSLTA